MQFYGILNQEDFEKEIEEKLGKRLEEEKQQYEEYYSTNNTQNNNYVYEPSDTEINYILLEIYEELLTEKKIITGFFENDLMSDFEASCELEFNPTFEDFKYERNIRDKLSENIYQELVKLYNDTNRPIKTKFFEGFNDKVYGEKYKKARKYALEEFKRIFNEVHFSMDFYPIEIGNSTYPLSKIERLYKEKHSIIKRMSIKSFLPFLYGNLDLYQTPLYHDQSLVNQIISFHSKADILLQLNFEYNFEKDILFNKISDYQTIAINLCEKFNSEQAFVFTMYTINTWDNVLQTELYGLYDFLIQHNMYEGTDSNFIRIVETEFYLTFDRFKKTQDNKVELKHKETPTIKEFETKHSKRVKSHKKQWEIFISEYYPGH